MKRQKHVTVVAIREVSRVKQILMIREKIDTVDTSGNESKVEIFSLPNVICLGRSAPDVAKNLINELVHESFNDEMSFPLVPAMILPANEASENFIVFGSISDDTKNDESPMVCSNDNLYWISVQEVYYRLSKQLVHDETFKDGKYIGLNSLVALSVLKTMNLLG